MCCSVEVSMSRHIVGRPSKILEKSPSPIGGGQRVARLFMPAYDGGISIAIPARRRGNSDARRRLARLFESRRVVS
jgi:hypothetical protein